MGEGRHRFNVGFNWAASSPNFTRVPQSHRQSCSMFSQRKIAQKTNSRLIKLKMTRKNSKSTASQIGVGGSKCWGWDCSKMSNKRNEHVTETHGVGLLPVLIAAKSGVDFLNGMDTCIDFDWWRHMEALQCTGRYSLQEGFILKKFFVMAQRSFVFEASSSRRSQFQVSP